MALSFALANDFPLVALCFPSVFDFPQIALSFALIACISLNTAL
jgi:hypothetical protein